MRTIWEYSSRTEALRLLHCARQIASGFYKANGFLVLPYPAPAQPNVVSFPRLPYLTIPRFWQRSSRLDIRTYPFTTPKDLLVTTQQLLASNPLPSPDFSLLQLQWSKHQNQILRAIYSLIPKYRKQIRRLHLLPTAFGSSCSFSSDRKRSEMYIWIRTDSSLTQIVEAILTSLTRADIFDTLGGTWSESEIVTDWLISFSPLNPLLRRLDSHWENALTLRSTRAKQLAKLKLKSDQFLTQIGAPEVDLTTIKNIDTTRFSPQEKQLFQLLLNKSPQLATFDEIADHLYSQNPDRFSLYAISKTVQRLRDQLESHGISGGFIQTHRGQGYLLAS